MDDLFAGAVKAHALRLRSRALEMRGLVPHLHAHVFDVLVADHHRHGHVDRFEWREASRKRGKNHQRIFYLDDSLAFTVGLGFVVSSHHHHAHRADVIRHRYVVHVFAALFQVVGAYKTHDGLEARELVLALGREGIVATDGIHAHKLALVGAQYIVVHVKGLHAQRFGLIKGLPRRRCLVIGQVQQTLVDDGKGIGHGLATALADAHDHLRQRAHLIGHLNHRLELGLLIFHIYSPYPVQSDRQVVVGVVIGLYEMDDEVYIGRHVLSDGQSHLMLIS